MRVRANAVFASLTSAMRVSPFAGSTTQHSKSLTVFVLLAAVLVLAVHLLGSPPTAHQTSSVPPSHEPILSTALSDHRHANDAAATASSATAEQPVQAVIVTNDGTEADTPNDADCGELVPSSKSFRATTALYPTFGCLELLPPAVQIPGETPAATADPRTPSPVRELGVLRI